MYLITKALTETAKTFLMSILCSVVFALMIYRDSALPSTFVCTLLNTSALLLFLFLHFLNWSRLFENSFSPSEYYVPALTAAAIYSAVSAVLYSKRFFLYMWFFLPTRFLEPQLTADFAFASVIISHFLFFILIFLTPVLCRRR